MWGSSIKIGKKIGWNMCVFGIHVYAEQRNNFYNKIRNVSWYSRLLTLLIRCLNTNYFSNIHLTYGMESYIIPKDFWLFHSFLGNLSRFFCLFCFFFLSCLNFHLTILITQSLMKWSIECVTPLSIRIILTNFRIFDKTNNITLLYANNWK